MLEEQRQEIIQNADYIMAKTLDEIDEKTQNLHNIQYYDKFQFVATSGSGLEERNIYIVKINGKEKITSKQKEPKELETPEQEKVQEYSIYQIYDKDKNLIATVDKEGNIHFTPEYVESLQQKMPQLYQLLQLTGLKLQLPKELGENDLALTQEDIEKEMTIYKNGTIREQNHTTKKEEKTEMEQQDKEQQKVQSKEEKDTQVFAKRKNIPTHNVLKVKENSNLYKDHPELEPNLYFYRDQNGTVRAEYIDENGISQPSKYFEPSTTSLRQETVSLGDDGKPVTKEVPYQVMKTKGLNSADKDIRDIRMTVEIDAYGYLSIQEARQGKNGEWLSHEIEMQGRDYNSHAVNQVTSIKTREADPDKQTKAYESLEGTEVAEDGIEYSEMYLISHAEEIIDELIKEGYQKKEATKIFDYMIGEEKLTEEEAKQKVNEEMEKGNLREEQTNESNATENAKQEEINQGEERTPWGDAMRRSRKF